MVFCKDYRTKQPIEVTQPFPGILKCENKLYTIDPEKRSSFFLANLLEINICPKGDALYTMFLIEDGTADETWNDRWKPDVEAYMADSNLALGDDSRRKRKAALLETMALAMMELMDMQNEDDRAVQGGRAVKQIRV
jgi:hypothetical protein